ncbi:MAG: nickel-dependent lactate racemase [bacterium]|jgi:nickel-dependent lactate racemase|nr:nickel-dependent lactate racemase [candidate division KSB1 bacterium]MDH7559965.1 nickel-dependent lactate racemase [bacterium]
MQLRLAYGRSSLTVELPDERVLAVVDIGDDLPAAEEDTIKAALSKPLGAPPLERLVRRGERTTIVIPDASRRCGARVFLPLLIDLLNRKGIHDRDITVLFATGSHGLQVESERQEVVGPELYRRVRTVDHDCRQLADLVRLGETVNGTPVWLHKYVVKAERLLVAGGTSHHPLTGYAGGPKLLNPGCAGLETVLRCHALGVDVTRGGLVATCAPGVAAGNPIYQDIVDSTKFVQVDFALHLIVDAHGRVRQACAGALAPSWERARQLADSFYKVPVAQRVPLVIASCGGAPFDDDFVKSFRAVRNAALLVSDGGHLLLIAECRAGLGCEHFLDFFATSTPHELASKLRQDYRSFGTTALGLRELLRRIRVTVVGMLPPAAPSAMGIRVEPSAQVAVEQALSELPPGAKLAVLPHAHFTLPVVERG